MVNPNMIARALQLAQNSVRAGFDDGGPVPSGFTADTSSDVEAPDYRPLNYDKLASSGAVRVTMQGDQQGNYNPDPKAGFSIVSGWNEGYGKTPLNWPTHPEKEVHDTVRDMFAKNPELIAPYKYRQILESAKKLGISDNDIYVKSKASGGSVRRGYDSGGKTRSIPVAADPAPAAQPVDNPQQTSSAPTQQASTPSLSDQIGQAYQDVLGRSGDAPGMQWWNDQITSGKSSLNNLYGDLLNSDEFNSNLKTAGYNGEGVTASTPIDTGPNGGVITSNDQQGPKPAYLADFNYSDYGDPLSARYAYLSQALNPTIAAALMGNWQIESGNNPTQMQTVGGLDSAPRNLTSSGLPMGFGSAQWGGTRLQNDSGDPNKMGLLDFTKQYGYDPNTTEGNDRFTVYELQRNPEYANTYAAAQKAGTNLDSVTRILGGGWESPKNLSATLGDRQASADMYFNKYGPGGNFDPADQTEINQTLARIQDPAFNKQYAGPTIQEYMAAAQNNIGNNGPATATADATPTDTGSLTQPASVVDGNTILGNGTTDTVNGTANAGLNANPVLGNNGLMTDNTPIQTNSTNITGTNIIPWQNGLDPSLGSSSNGIPFGFGTSAIDTGANPLGDYSNSGLSGLGANGFDFTMFNRGGAVDRALRIARAAGGMIGQTPEASGERALDRMNRILSQRAKSGAFEDDQSRKYNYLQNAPGSQIRDNSFADGGEVDDSDISSSSGEAPPTPTDNPRPTMTPAEIARRWTPPEDYGAQSPAPETMNKDLTWDKLGDALSKYPQHLIDKWTDTVKYPGDITMGNKKFNTDEAIQKSLELSQLAMTGGIGGAAARPGEAIFGSGPIRTTESKLANSTKVDPMGLYSHAAETAANLPQAKGSPEQMKAMLLKNGVKPEEMRWSGFDDAFAGKPQVTKDELINHFNDKKPNIEEKVLKGDWDNAEHPSLEDFHENVASYPEDFNNVFPELAHKNLSQEHRNSIVEDPVSMRRIEDYWKDMTEGTDPTKYSEYSLPGGDNYREVLLKHPLPEKGKVLSKDEWKIESRWGASDPESYARLGLDRPFDSFRNSTDRMDYIAEHEGPTRTELGDSSLYNSSHWDDPNVIAHLRMKDRTGPEGENILHLEEIQSDWGQEGRKKGFAQSIDPEAVKQAQEKLDETSNVLRNHLSSMGLSGAEMDSAMANARSGRIPSWVLGDPKNEHFATDFIDAIKHRNDISQTGKTSTAPYVEKTGDWTDLALKRALKEAADNGHDIVTWSPGEVNAAHYPGGDPGMAEGMKGYYDRIVPNQMNKLVKKLDPAAKVETHQVPVDIDPSNMGFGDYVKQVTGNENMATEAQKHYEKQYPGVELPDNLKQLAEDYYIQKPYYLQPMQGVRMTDKMRAAIKKGLPAYKRGGTV